MVTDRDCIYIFNEEEMWLKIMMRDIYYIETIKSTHYCEVVMRAGSGRLRADITPLQKELPEYFFRTRASTLANLRQVRKVDTVRRILYFDETVFCTYTKRVAQDIKRLLQLKPYRKYIGGMACGPDADASV